MESQLFSKLEIKESTTKSQPKTASKVSEVSQPTHPTDYMLMVTQLTEAVASKERVITNLLKITEKQVQKHKAEQEKGSDIIQSLKHELDRKKKILQQRNQQKVEKEAETATLRTTLQEMSRHSEELRVKLTKTRQERDEKIAEIAVWENGMNECLPRLFAERKALKEEMQGLIDAKSEEIQKLTKSLENKQIESEQSQNKLCGAKQIVDAIKRDLNHKKAQIEEMKGVIQSKDMEIGKLEKAVNDQKSMLQGFKGKCSKLQKFVDTLQGQVDETENEIKCIQSTRKREREEFQRFKKEKAKEMEVLGKSVEVKSEMISDLEQQIEEILSEKKTAHSMMQNVIQNISRGEVSHLSQVTGVTESVESPPVTRDEVIQKLRRLLDENAISNMDVGEESALHSSDGESAERSFEHMTESKEWTEIISEFKSEMTRTQQQVSEAAEYLRSRS